MRIIVKRIGFDVHRTELFHLLKLYYDNVDIAFEPADEANAFADEGTAADIILTIKARADQDGERTTCITATAEMEIPAESKVRVKTHVRPVTLAGEEGFKRALKRAIGYTVLMLLQEETGIVQPWGSLTGVRPTKLVHNLLRSGTREDVLHTLQEDYLVTEEKARLVTEIAELQLKVIPDLYNLNREVSVYIGIPFCPTKCAYCTFPAYDIRGNNGSVAAFLEGLHYEIRETGRWLKLNGLKITTLYWGGGTPTSIEAEEMDALFAELHRSFPGMSEVRELTVEAGRPDTITPDKLDVMKKWKVDRISINPQSFTQATLDAIGRHHTVTETVDKFLLARKMGLSNINMDLIIGLPGEGVEEYRHSLAETSKLLPESLTVHTLSFKRASRMTKNKDDYEVAERDEISEMMHMTSEWTGEHGYKPYYLYRQKNILGNQENVGYSLLGKESLYNILMMEERQTIIGLGCGAVSKIVYPADFEEQAQDRQKIERFPNPKEPAAYNKAYKEYTEKKLALLSAAYMSKDRAPIGH
ncbi:coproporphyrinogen III oxidase [Gorillibacterium massiliense]|uniref:coproporphyrinogen III oxidase n=1 Tax=Gorillibacterium massiliense TaxID=1280390 RepID=UPI0004B767B5|nr:coproporphyrinogen III oxidase [Gorillibacterium massiliense]